MPFSSSDTESSNPDPPHPLPRTKCAPKGVSLDVWFFLRENSALGLPLPPTSFFNHHLLSLSADACLFLCWIRHSSSFSDDQPPDFPFLRAVPQGWVFFFLLRLKNTTSQVLQSPLALLFLSLAFPRLIYTPSRRFSE